MCFHSANKHEQDNTYNTVCGFHYYHESNKNINITGQPAQFYLYFYLSTTMLTSAFNVPDTPHCHVKPAHWEYHENLCLVFYLYLGDKDIHVNGKS